MTKKRNCVLNDIKYGFPVFRLMLVRENEILSDTQKSVTLDCPFSVVDFIQPMFHYPEEHFISLHMNAKNEVIGLHEVSHGTLSSSLVHPREVFKAALVANSYSIIVCHNHPSGSRLKPSDDDLRTTRNLIEAGDILGVSVVDHLIVGGLSGLDWYSIREYHPELWQSL